MKKLAGINIPAFALVVCLPTPALYARQYTSVLYNVESGLPSSYAFKTLEDSRGFLWVGTNAGLSRFDGKHFVNYSINDGLPSNKINALFENNRQELVIGTKKGLSIFDGKRFRNYTPPGITNTYFDCITEPKDGQLRMLINLKPYVFKKDRFIKETITNITEEINTYQIVTFKDDKRAFVSDKKLYILNTAGQATQIPSETAMMRTIPGSVPSDTGQVIGEDGVYRLYNNKLSLLWHYDFKNKIILAALKDSRNRIWISLESHGTLLYEQGSLITLGAKEGIEPLFTSDIIEDASKNIWLGNGYGLYKIKPAAIKVYSKDNGLATNDIRYMALCNDGNIYISQNMRWYASVNGDKLLQPSPAIQHAMAPHAKRSRVASFATDDRNRLWIGQASGQLFRVDGQKFADLTSLFKDLNFYNQEMFFNSSDSTLWLPLNNGILLIKNDRIIDSLTKAPNGKPIGYIKNIKKDNQGNIWLSGATGLYVYDNGTLRKVSFLQDDDNIPLSYECNTGNTWWFATDGRGVIGCVYKYHSLKIRTIIDTRSGLRNNSVNNIVADNNGNLWVVTQAGICFIDRSKPRSVTGNYYVYDFSTKDGVPFANATTSSLVKDTRGDIWYATQDGILRFDLATPLTDTIPPAVLLEKIQIRNKNGSWHELAGNNTFFHLPVLPELSYTEDAVSFAFTGVYTGNGSVTYQYRLEGLEKTWQEQNDNTPVAYYNLPSGRYTFVVKAATASGMESNIIKYAFSIRPPFWKTWWFHALLALLVVSIIFFFIKRRERNIRKHNQLQLQMSELRMQALQAQMNPHFIFNSLNSIQNYILGNDPLDAAKYLAKFSKLIRRILDNSKHAFLPLEQIIDTLRIYVELEAFRFNKEFSYSFSTGSDETLLQTELPPMLFQPFVENAIWHGLMPKKGEKILSVSMQRSHNNIICIIDDNGVGRKTGEEKKDHQSQGQKLTKGLLESMQQLQNIEATLHIEDKTDNGMPAGTRIIIIIPSKL